MATPATLRVFVYGTLKKGYWNHEPYMGPYAAVEPSCIRGRLHVRHTGTPILEIPPEDLLARGSGDPTRDLETFEHTARQWTARAPAADGDWLRVAGELYTLPDPVDALQRLDGLEGFTPLEPGGCLYDRALAPMGEDGATLAWVYVIPSHARAGDYGPAKDPACWRGEVELDPATFARRMGRPPLA